MRKRHSQSKYSSHNPFHANDYLSKIDKIALNETSNKHPKHLSSSVKLIHKQIKSISSIDPKFTQSPVYLEGKSKLNFSRNSLINDSLLSNLSKIIEQPDPNGSYMITPDIINSKTAKKLLQQRKRTFGSKLGLFYPESTEDNKLIRSISKEQSDLLKKIIYNFKFLNSGKAENEKILQINKKKVLKNKLERIGTVKYDPSSLNMEKKKESFDEMNIEEDYQKAIKKHDLENELKKVHLSRLVSLRKVFRK